MDDNYQIYLNRVARMTLPEAYKSQIQHIQESSKFQPTSDGKREVAPFPGYTIITPPGEEDKQNSAFYEKLQDYQQQLLGRFVTRLRFIAIVLLCVLQHT